jgi:hypothetical protein
MSELDIFLHHLSQVNATLPLLFFFDFRTSLFIFFINIAIDNFSLHVIRIRLVLINEVVLHLLHDYLWGHDFRAVVFDSVDPGVVVDVFLLCELELWARFFLFLHVIKIVQVCVLLLD